ncbi:proline racemase family protein [Alisedimentitalea sp. MJ-SS2]|uniref:proline racemase family protein n=1 Tax=Aliisedimentitalea sp. MJ-SS2 TaxID=3049795 RepID=UPI00290AF6DD|nr:proline racemase family protein [Alisedimentitalea sp. MJ-SS2]MDU8927486.1 proline racemase family protein [Alisedimentitalea sp. MJ-SS2]
MRISSVITAVDAHAEGEPGRVITAGLPHIPGASVYEKMRWLEEHRDDIRLAMLREPRGYPALCCNAIVPPCDPQADAGFIIMEQTEYPPMSGSNTICTVTVLLETGLVPMVEPVTELTLETPAGLIRVRAECRNGKVNRVKFRNVPGFAVRLDTPLEVPGYGTAKVDIAWGGMFFVIAEAAQFGIAIEPDTGGDMVRLSEALRHAAVEQLPVIHPENPGITGPTIAQLTGPATRTDAHGKSAVTVSSGVFDPAKPHALTGVLDRSPCGTGTCAKMACLHARGLLAPGVDYVNEGPMGTTFTGRIEGTTQVGPYQAILPTLSGQGWITGMANYMIDPSDPFAQGFTVSDLWG